MLKRPKFISSEEWNILLKWCIEEKEMYINKNKKIEFFKDADADWYGVTRSVYNQHTGVWDGTSSAYIDIMSKDDYLHYWKPLFEIAWTMDHNQSKGY